MKYVYTVPKDIDKDTFLHIVKADDRSLICDALVSAVHCIDDYEWLLAQYVVLLNHSDGAVRGVTVTCIGHLARLHREANKEYLLAILEPLQKDSDVAGNVIDAIDDINMFL